ncbi:smoothelin-like isoform X7 [Acipenser ruthenus]|uniref:smoothelin-like isoform X7 n=1 Tax=Acipenser ruthenus TaxID=7906 RepID=UPI002741520E|nr:smoothelin-like isoform X7 [Acipenser ruthenus]
MSGERYSTLDESSLRKLLDGTSDLDERRLIRSAIREIRRCEIEGMEAALSFKRFRGARNCEQLENKENQIRFQRLCPDQDDTLEALSGKLQSIEDVDELTALLRGASEYEERKLIRAAIRKLRAQELEASEKAICESRLESFQWRGSREADPEPAHSKADLEIDNLEERQRIRAQIRELRSQQNQEEALQRAGMTSGMVLVLDPLNKEEATLPSRQRLYSEASERELASRQRLDSRASDRDLSSRQRLDSGASDRDLSSRQRLDSGSSERDLSSLQRQSSELISASSTDSELECESRLTGGAPEQALLGGEDMKEGEGVSQTDQDKDLVDGNAFSRGGPCKKEPVSQNSLQNRGEKRAVNGELGGCSSSSRQTSVTKDPLYSRSQTSLSCAKDKELTLGLRATPFKIISSSNTSGALKMEMEPVLAAEATETPPSDTDVVPNCTQGAHGMGEGHRGKLTAEELEAIEDEEVLDKMIDETTDFEERKLIRAAMRDLRKKKRDALLGGKQRSEEDLDQREKEREKERETRLQEMKQKQEEKRSQTARAGEMVVRKTEKISHSDDGSRASRTTTMEASYMKRSENSTTVVQTKSSFSSTSSSTSTKKMGSIFDREDDSSSRALERKQAERHKEIMRSQTLPKTSATQARKAMIEKLEKGSGSPANPAVSRVVKVQKTSSFGVPNANSIKQMLLDWCRAKTRGYEHVDIQNFSSSWSDGMAFCALVHNFFPESFDYMALNPQNRRKNFEVAFTNAETLADCPQLLDVEDMVRMREPDWKCVYTYIQEFYRGLVQKGLVKTKNS